MFQIRKMNAISYCRSFRSGLFVLFCIAIQTVSAQQAMVGSLDGVWTVRLIRNAPELKIHDSEIVFGSWTLHLNCQSEASISGHFEKDGWKLSICEARTNDATDVVELFAEGKVGDSKWRLESAIRPSAIVENFGPTNDVWQGTAKLTCGTKKSELFSLILARQPEQPFIGRKIHWQLKRPNGEAFDSATELGSAHLLIFSQGFSCLHCSEQIQKLNSTASQPKYKNFKTVVLVSERDVTLPSSMDLNKFPLTLIADPEQQVFEQFGLNQHDSTHAVFVVDESGTIVWSATGKTAYMDLEIPFSKLEQLKNSSLKPKSKK